MTEPIKKNAFSLAANLSIVPFKLFLTVPAVSVPGLILCIARFFNKRKCCYPYTDLAKKNFSIKLLNTFYKLTVTNKTKEKYNETGQHKTLPITDKR